MNQVDDDVDVRVPAGGLGADQVQLVLGAVDQDNPGPPATGVAGLGSSNATADQPPSAEVNSTAPPLE